MKEEISAGGIVYKKVTGDRLQVTGYKWLVCQHSQHKGWVFPKGLVGDEVVGEKPEVAAVREVREEGGVTAKIISKLHSPVVYFYKWQGELRRKTVHYFLMEYISGDPADHDEEMLEALFIPTNEVEKKLTYKSDKKSFEQALKIFKQI